MQNKPFYFQMEVKGIQENSDSNVVVIDGYASTPDLDRYRDIVEPSAFKDSLTMFMKNPVLLYQHDPNRPVGTITSAVVTEKGLKVRAEIVEEDAKQKVKDGRMRAMSFGWIPLETELQHEDGTEFNFETDSIWDSDLVRVVKKLDLVEISIVTTPANGNALFTVAKSVKSYFNQLVTKSFMSNKKDPEKKEGDTTVAEGEENKPQEQAEGDKNVEKEEAGVMDEVQTGEEEEKEESEEAAAEGAQANEGTEEAKSSPSEEAEKAGETTAADSAEGSKAEEAKAEAKPEGEKSEESGTENQPVAVSEEVAKALPELVSTGHMVMTKEAGKEVAIPKGVVTLLRNLSDAFIAEAKRASELEEKLNNTPEKKALVNVESAQLGDGKKSDATAKQKAVSEGFRQLFKGAI